MILEVEEGNLQGIEKKSVLTGKPYWAFLGIPYAEPPIGDLRFKAPVPIKKWDGVLDASKEASVCFQMNYPVNEQEIVGSEDCLYLNIYTPVAPSQIKNKKSVMIFIHGGGFMIGSGSASLYGPDFLIGHDIILVTLNYRLHVFGFLNTNTPNCQGNAGLKDQLLAIKWIRKNIASFGGDPENITVFGESAGAASVHLHMFSPLSKGLYNRAIVQSGSALAPWAIEEDPETHARKIGRLAGYQGDSLEDMVEYLKQQPGKKLCELANECYYDATRNTPGSCAMYMFIPSIEKIKDDAFMPDFPKKLMESAHHIPAIFGFTDQEGISFFGSQAPGNMGLLLDNLHILVKNNFRLDELKQTELVSSIKEFYFPNEPITQEYVSQLVNLYTDLHFMKFYEAIDYLVQSSFPPYLYLFTYDGNLNHFKNFERPHVDLKNVQGASHGDDLGYLFSQTSYPQPTPMNEVDEKIIDSCCTLWTNFAKTGEPTLSVPNVNWKPHINTHPCYIRIEEPLKIVEEKLFENRLGFWKNWSPYFH